MNHIEGHIFSAFIENPQIEFPLLALVVSGGHTSLIYSPTPGTYQSIGRARDDAAGEALDKLAKFLGLGYPGGPIIDRLSGKGILDDSLSPSRRSATAVSISASAGSRQRLCAISRKKESNRVARERKSQSRSWILSPAISRQLSTPFYGKRKKPYATCVLVPSCWWGALLPIATCARPVQKHLRRKLRGRMASLQFESTARARFLRRIMPP